MASEFSRAFQSFRDTTREINTNIASFWRISSRKAPPKDVDLSGQWYVVTGGNRGFGRGVTLELVSRNANVIIGARGAEAAKEVIQEANKLCPNSAPKVTYFPLDLASFDSIETFSRSVHELLSANSNSRLNGLVNNAALWMATQKFTTAKKNQPEMELTWAVNFFGLVYLTHQLMDLFSQQSSSGARIVNVSSLAHLTVPRVDTCDPMARHKSFEWINNYAETKLALMFYTKQLAKQLAPKGIQVYGVDPGISQTELGANFGPVARWAMETWIARPIMRKPIEGSRSILFPLLFPGENYDVKKWYTW